MNRSAGIQAGYQCAGLVLTIAMAIVGGLLTGLILRLPIFIKPNTDSYFDDSLNWEVPSDFHNGETRKTRTKNNPNTIEVRNGTAAKYPIRPSSRQYHRKPLGLFTQGKTRISTR